MYEIPCVVVLDANMWLLQEGSGKICRSRSGRVLLFWARHCLAQERNARLSEKTWKPWSVPTV